MKKSTVELSKILESKRSSKELDDYLKENQENFLNQDFTEIFHQILKENKISKAEAVKRSSLDKSYAYEFIRGDKVPSRDKVIMLCIGMKADCEQAKRLLMSLKLAPLYAKDTRDSIIIFGLLHELSVTNINILLYEKNFEILE